MTIIIIITHQPWFNLFKYKYDMLFLDISNLNDIDSNENKKKEEIIFENIVQIFIDLMITAISTIKLLKYYYFLFSYYIFFFSHFYFVSKYRFNLSKYK
jgi:hypothetical protein